MTFRNSAICPSGLRKIRDFRHLKNSRFAARGNSARGGKVKSGIGLFLIYFPQHGIKQCQVKIRKNRGKSAKNIMGLRTRLPDMKYARVWPDSARGAIMLCGQHRPGGRADLTAATEPCVGEQSPHVRRAVCINGGRCRPPPRSHQSSFSSLTMSKSKAPSNFLSRKSSSFGVFGCLAAHSMMVSSARSKASS